MTEQIVIDEIKAAIQGGLELSGPWGKLKADMGGFVLYPTEDEYFYILEMFALLYLCDALEQMLTKRWCKVLIGPIDEDGTVGTIVFGPGGDLAKNKDKLTALWEAMKSVNNLCEHDWVKNPNGYVEQCEAMICTKCDKRGCACDAEREKTGPRGKKGAKQ